MSKVTYPTPSRPHILNLLLTGPFQPYPPRTGGTQGRPARDVVSESCLLLGHSFILPFLMNMCVSQDVLGMMDTAVNETARIPALRELCPGRDREGTIFFFLSQALCAWSSLDLEGFSPQCLPQPLGHCILCSMLPPPSCLPCPSI